MTSISLHPMPRWQAVATEQIRAVGLMTRSGAVALIGWLIVACVLVVRSSIEARGAQLRHISGTNLSVSFAPELSVAFALIAVLYAFAVWHDDDPSRRGYHWMMPVDPQVHTLTKVLAGWIWLLAATAICVVSIPLLGALSSMITGRPQPASGIHWWVWMVPFTSLTIAYMLASAAAASARLPWLWVAGITLCYGGLLLALEMFGYRDAYRIVLTVLDGEYGIVAAIAGRIYRLDTAHLQVLPSAGRWLGASALWGGSSAVLLVAMSRRRAEPWLAGKDHSLEGQRGAVMRQKWLLASVVAVAATVGVLAPRVVKPEYEARATLWNGPRPTGLMPTLQMGSATAPLDFMRSSRIADAVVQQLTLYAVPERNEDAPLLKTLSLADRYVPGNYVLAVDDRGTRWQLTVADSPAIDSGSVGDSIGRPMGLRWHPDPTLTATHAGSVVKFAVETPRDAAEALNARLKISQPPNSSFLSLSLTDVDPSRAASVLNAMSAQYLAKVREAKGADISVLDSAVAPTHSFKNSPSQLFGLALVIGVVVAIGLGLALSAIEYRSYGSRPTPNASATPLM